MADIFVSYARQDKDRLQPLVHKLKEIGWSVFWDPTIVPGEQWDSLIERELKSAKCIVVAWSKQSIAREWVRIEAHHGRTRGVLVPVIIEECEIPITFSHIQTEDLSRSDFSDTDSSLRQLVEGISRLAGRPSPTVLEESGRPDEEATHQHHSTPDAGSDLRYDLTISLADAFYGKTTTVSFTSASEGTASSTRTLTVNVPAGVEDGMRIRLAGEGEAGRHGAPAGDLYIFLSVPADRMFQRDGADLFMRVPIALSTAALGGTIDVPTIEGTIARISIPEGTQTGKQFRLRGKGMPILRSKERGDLYLQCTVEIPTNLDAQQRKALEDLGKQLRATNFPEVEKFDKVRDETTR